MISLTDRQSSILEYIKAHIELDGMPPTRAEIQAFCGFKSANAAQEHLLALEKKGYIALSSGKARAIKVMK